MDDGLDRYCSVWRKKFQLVLFTTSIRSVGRSVADFVFGGNGRDDMILHDIIFTFCFCRAEGEKAVI